MLTKISQWSFSTWHSFSKCSMRVKYAKIDRLPQDPPGPAAQRGNRVHSNAEDHVLKGSPLGKILKDWHNEFKSLLRKTEKADHWSAEQEWAFTKKWKTIGWNAKRAWVRAKLDFCIITGKKGLCVDYKTGRKYAHHDHQMDLYALMMFIKFPQINHVECQLWYIDQGEIVSDTYTRAGGYEYLLEVWTERGLEVTECTEFVATPGDCQWCSFAKSKGGPCQYS